MSAELAAWLAMVDALGSRVSLEFVLQWHGLARRLIHKCNGKLATHGWSGVWSGVEWKAVIIASECRSKHMFLIQWPSPARFRKS